MRWETFISVEELHPILHSAETAVFDCRYDLTAPAWGHQAYLESHIPGAQYVDLEEDLSAEPDGQNGRHPLPSTDELSELFSRLGIDGEVQVICYDDQGGGYAARMWWSLRYLGHPAVAVLIGGYPAWVSAGLPTESSESERNRRRFEAHPDSSMLIRADRIQELIDTPELLMIDSRAPERYRGETEPWDPVAGHIPGARNRFWQDNLDQDLRLLPRAELMKAFRDLLDHQDPSSVAVYCGSGVTGCLNVLAMKHAGLGLAKLYAGSWSEWCSDPDRPVRTGPTP